MQQEGLGLNMAQWMRAFTLAPMGRRFDSALWWVVLRCFILKGQYLKQMFTLSINSLHIFAKKNVRRKILKIIILDIRSLFIVQAKRYANFIVTVFCPKGFATSQSIATLYLIINNKKNHMFGNKEFQSLLISK